VNILKNFVLKHIEGMVIDMPQTHVKNYHELDMLAEEAYNTLRTNIQFCSAVKKIKTITITSCNAEEGKTTVSINLAISMAKTGLKTLLVDTDLRKPSIADTLKILEIYGITEYLSGGLEIEDIIYATHIKNFFVTPCITIPPNPAELLSTEKFRHFIQTVRDDFINTVKGQFDIIIFDSPPLGSVIDAAILAAGTDGTIMVIKSKFINYKAAQQVKEQLEKVKANLIGVVLNRIKKKDYSYYYNYYYSSNYKTKKRREFFRKLQR
jgi:protein-tyrosine kinase